MKTMKRALCLALCLALAVMAVGCSTPKVAMTVGDTEYTTAEYLAYLYQNASQIYQYYSYFGDVSTMWDQTMPYENPYDMSEEEETSEASEASEAETGTTATGAGVEIKDNGIAIPEYIKTATKDQLVFLTALKAVMDENGLKISDDDLKAAETALASYQEADLLDKGFSLENFKKMYLATTYYEDTVYDGMFGVKGKQATKQADIDKYFDDNYLAYEIIQVALVDTDGNALTDEEIAAKKADLEGYRNVFYATGDFDEAIAAYDSATAADSEDTEKKEYDTDYDGEPKENVTSNNSQNVQTVDAGSDNADQDLVKLVRSVKEGEVAIAEYNQNGKSKMAALVYRIDPDGKGRDTYRADSTDAIIRTLRESDFKALVKAKVDALEPTVSVNKRAVKMCDPKDFFE